MAFLPGGKFGGLPVQSCDGFPTNEICADLQAMVDKGRWPGFAACAFTGDGTLDRCLFSCRSGKSDIAKGAPMSCDTIVRLYSMTKAFVAVGILRLADRRLLRLDDPAWKHLPAPVAERFRHPRVAGEVGATTKLASGPITIRQLLTHTSGLGSDIARGLDALTRKRGRWEGMYAGLTADVDEGRIQSIGQFVEALSEYPLWQHPGREFYYSYGYDVLGYIIENLADCPLDEFLHKEVFMPLGMRDTSFAVPKDKAKRLARLYRHTKAKRFGADGIKAELRPVDSRFVEGRHCPVWSGGGCVGSRDGGLTSTLRDYSKFLVCLFNHGLIRGSGERLISEMSARLLLQNQIEAVGGLSRSGQPRIFAHNRKGIGLNLVGEVQLPGCEPDAQRQWFDGVPGLMQWGGAASTFYKYQVVNGRPLLLITFTQVLPQDDGRSCSDAFARMRAWADSLPPVDSRKRRRLG